MAGGPKQIGPYRVTDKLGQGGMGAVYRGEHVELGSVRAVKVLGKRNQRARARFEREARSLASIRHPAVVGIHEFGFDEDQPWFSMDLVEGEPLDEVIKRGRFPVSRAIELALEIGRGLQALHAAGIVHRDLKPQNVMITHEGRAVILDLGLALSHEQDERLTRTGAMLGTLCYMAPEQALGKRDQQGPWTDVYRLGMILFELATGEQSFDMSSGGASIVREIVNVDRPAPSSVDADLPVGLDRVFRRATARELSERYQSAAELVSALAELQGERGPTRRQQRRRGLLVAGAIGLAIAMTSAVAIWSLGVDRRGAPVAATSPARAPVSPPPSPSLALSEDELEEGARELQRMTRVDDAGARLVKATEWLGRYSEHPRAAEARALWRQARLELPVASWTPHRGTVRVRYLGRGDLALSAPERGELVLWDLAGAEPLELRRWRPRASLPAMGVGPDAQTVFVGGGREVYRIDVDELEPTARWKLPAQIALVAVSPDGGVLAVGRIAVDETESYVHLLGLPAGEELRSLGPMRSWLRTDSMAFSPDGSKLAVGTGNNFVGQRDMRESLVTVWEVETGRKLGEAETLAQPYVVRWAPDGSAVLAGASSRRLVLYDPRTGEELGYFQGRGTGQFGGGFDPFPTAHNGNVRAVLFSPERDRVYTLSEQMEDPRGHELCEWTWPRREELRRLSSLRPYWTADLSPDGRHLLAGTMEGGLELWDLRPEPPE